MRSGIRQSVSRDDPNMFYLHWASRYIGDSYYNATQAVITFDDAPRVDATSDLATSSFHDRVATDNGERHPVLWTHQILVVTT